jgi:hypothetical protein
MVQLFGDQLRHPRRPGRAVGVRVWLRTLDDLLSSVPRQQWETFMEQTSTITRAVIVTSVVAIVAALATGLAVVTAGIGPAIPLAILFALVVVIYHHQHRLPARDPARACRDGNGPRPALATDPPPPPTSQRARHPAYVLNVLPSPRPPSRLGGLTLSTSSS